MTIAVNYCFIVISISVFFVGYFINLLFAKGAVQRARSQERSSNFTNTFLIANLNSIFCIFLIHFQFFQLIFLHSLHFANTLLIIILNSYFTISNIECHLILTLSSLSLTPCSSLSALCSMPLPLFFQN